MAKKSIFELGKSLKLPKMQFRINKFDLFDFTSFFAWTFLKILARCVGGYFIYFSSSYEITQLHDIFYIGIQYLRAIFEAIFFFPSLMYVHSAATSGRASSVMRLGIRRSRFSCMLSGSADTKRFTLPTCFR